MKLTIMIACFNERSTILKAIEQAKSINIDKEIIVIDNCSTDGTRQILKGLKNDREFKVILNPKNMGAGYSTRESIRIAQGDYFHAPGADLEYKMEDVYKMMNKMESENLDVVFGSRLLDRKHVFCLNLIKERPYWLGSIIATFLINLFYQKNFTDVIATKLIKTDILKKLNLKSDNEAFEFELVSRLCKAKYRTGEIGIWYKPRTHKEGKTIRAVHMIPAILAILKIKFFG